MNERWVKYAFLAGAFFILFGSVAAYKPDFISRCKRVLFYKEDLVMNIDDLLGSWKLLSFDLSNDGKSWKSWGPDTQGKLSYSPDGSMLVEIDKNLEDGNRDEDDMLHYGGSFEVKGSRIYHQVTSASDPSRIGKELIRDVEFEDDRMVLTGKATSGVQFRLVWKRSLEAHER